MLVQYATAKIGAVLVNINPAYRSHELQYVLTQAGIRMLVAAPSFKTSDYAGMIAQVRGNCPELEQVVLLGYPEWNDIVEAGRAALSADRTRLDAAQAGLSPDDPINIQYTSGTTGFPPKGGPPSAITTSSTTASSSGGSCATTPRTTRCASRCRSTTASVWSWATSPARVTARPW